MFFYGRKCVMGCGGSKVFKTLKPTYFQEQPNGGGKYWMEHGNQKAVPISPLRERGKVRPIDAPHITDRQIHKTLCNEVLVPLYNPCMSMKTGLTEE